MFEEMTKFNVELCNAGIMLSGDGLKPSSAGKRVAFNGASRSVTDGPFSATNELIAGFWIWQVKDMDGGGGLGETLSQSNARRERYRNPPLYGDRRFRRCRDAGGEEEGRRDSRQAGGTVANAAIAGHSRSKNGVASLAYARQSSLVVQELK